MDEFIKEIVADYKEDILTWHDIQDIIMAQFRDNKKQNEILAEIEKELEV